MINLDAEPAEEFMQDEPNDLLSPVEHGDDSQDVQKKHTQMHTSDYYR